MKCLRIIFVIFSVLGSTSFGSAPYAILSSQTTSADPEWRKVINALATKYNAIVKIEFPEGGLAMDFIPAGEGGDVGRGHP